MWQCDGVPRDSCAQKRHLTLQFANDVLAKKYINREIEIIESETYKCKIKEATRKAIKKYRFNWDQREKEINERYRVHLSLLFLMISSI